MIYTHYHWPIVVLVAFSLVAFSITWIQFPIIRRLKKNIYKTNENNLISLQKERKVFRMTSTVDLDALHYKNNSKSQYSQAYHLLEDLKISPEASILDIGCGHGHIIEELSKLVPSGSTVGIDPSENMISLASKTFPEREYSNLEFHQMKAEELDFDPESFDLILCTNAFMWIRDPRKVLKLISNLLKTKGQFYFIQLLERNPLCSTF